MSQIEKLLLVKETQKELIRKYYNKDQENIEEDLKLLLAWLGKQPHLPQIHDVNRLERFLLRNKFRVERTKMKLDKYYTYRGLYPEFFINVSPDMPVMQNARKSARWIPFPELLPSGERLIMYHLVGDEIENFNFLYVFSDILMIADIQLSYDYEIADRFVLDYGEMSLKHVVKMDPSIFAKGAFLFQEAFSGRISYLEFINLPSIFHLFMDLLKKVLPTKMYAKVRTHKDLDSLYEVIPKEYLPQEYGGSQPSMYEIHDEWGKELILQKEFLQENSKLVSDENLRIGKPIHNELFGVDGTFKRINVD